MQANSLSSFFLPIFWMLVCRPQASVHRLSFHGESFSPAWKMEFRHRTILISYERVFLLPFGSGYAFFVLLMLPKPPSATSPPDTHRLVQQVVKCLAFVSDQFWSFVSWLLCHGEDVAGMRQGWKLWLFRDWADHLLISFVSSSLAYGMTVWRSLVGLDLQLGLLWHLVGSWGCLILL